jgi:hypothetical protein
MQHKFIIHKNADNVQNAIPTNLSYTWSWAAWLGPKFWAKPDPTMPPDRAWA